ncbi:MAG: hypothetical protein ABI333_27620 [bacterium]
MKKVKVLIAAALMVAVTSAGCGSTTTFYSVAYKEKLELGKDKFLIMPVDFHGFPANMKTMLELTIFAGFIATFGKYGISLQPIKAGFEAAGFGNLSWHLAHGIFHVASFHKNGDLKKDRCQPFIGPMLAIIGKFANWVVGALKAAGVPIPEGYKFKYVLTAHVDRQGDALFGKGTKYRVIGGIVDIEAQQIVAATWFTKSTMNNKAAYVAALGTLGKSLLKAFKPVFVPKKKG